MTELRFPDGFEWATATAAHQIEGNNTNNDWWAWEHAEGTVCIEPSGVACNSWELGTRDVEVLRDLGLTSYRFSVEWSRIEPEPGHFDHASLDHYARFCEALLSANIRPTVTLHHFTTPLWATESGGWTNPDCADRFAIFSQRVAERLDGLAARYCTLNEPNMVAAMGYLMGLFPPGDVEDRAGHDLAAATMVRAHRLSVDAVRSVSAEVPVGITVSMMDYQAAEGGEQQVAAAEALENLFLDATEGDDFVGVQTYSRMLMGPNGWLGPQPGVPVVASMGYEFWPESIGACVRRAWDRTGGSIPILVTENGIATDDDRERIAFVSAALRSVHECLTDSINVLGYTYWSLLDNFEWAFGYGPKFGLVEVDRSSFARNPKPSAHWFGEVATSNTLLLTSP